VASLAVRWGVGEEGEPRRRRPCRRFVLPIRSSPPVINAVILTNDVNKYYIVVVVVHRRGPRAHDLATRPPLLRVRGDESVFEPHSTVQQVVHAISLSITIYNIQLWRLARTRVAGGGCGNNDGNNNNITQLSPSSRFARTLNRRFGLPPPSSLPVRPHRFWRDHTAPTPKVPTIYV